MDTPEVPTEAPQPMLHFERSISSLLRPGAGAERFGLPASAEPRLLRALKADLARADPLEAIVRALKLAAALDDELGSPAAGALIRRVLQSEPMALRLIRERLLKNRSLDGARAFAQREGREVAVRAPSYGAPAPPRTIPLTALFDPIRKSSLAHAAKRSRR